MLRIPKPNAERNSYFDYKHKKGVGWLGAIKNVLSKKSFEGN